MATKTLTGADWNTAGSFDPSGVPAGGDEVLLGPDSPALTTGPTGTNQDVKLDLLATHPDYKYNCCSSGSPLIISATKMLIQHPGDFFFQDHGGGASNKTNKIIVRCRTVNGNQQIQLGKSATDGGDIDKVEVYKGKVRITDASGLDEIIVDHLSNPAGDAILTIDSGAGTIPLVRALAGEVFCSAIITALHADDVLWHQLLNTITSLYAGGDGTTEFNTNATLTLAQIGGRHTFDWTKDFKVKTCADVRLSGKSKFLFFDDANLHIKTVQDWREAA